MAAKQKFPLRQPIRLTVDELWFLLNHVSSKYSEFNGFLARGQGGQRKLRARVTFLNRLQKKLWSV